MVWDNRLQKVVKDLLLSVQGLQSLHLVVEGGEIQMLVKY